MSLNIPYQSVNFENDCLLFHDLTQNNREQLLQISRLKTLSKQQYLVMQTTPADKLFNIVSGVATVEKISSNGRRQVISFLFPGDFVGLSHSDTYEYNIKSLSDLTVYEFKRKDLSSLSEKIPRLKMNLKNIDSLVLSIALEQVYLLGQLKAYERICFLLNQLLKRIPDASPEKIELPMSRNDIADYLGLTVETVSRSISQLKRDGVISTLSPNCICILKLDTIEELAATD
ncbi:helix-turn-helix domain-containing protein [Pseudocolwellia sp. AS88]|uniref:Crp/Fnr family transcriptional regulator n=1 Tax=Pseudocolwellia sp. AS88 TaxID=3063958 RepID=UPI0026EC7C30|nr:helix-turn-helix domain-containing protein [Pseudocolwellia sp. AS88]MDO7085366.1 helix-turn-helix domain-containing protein [Pseudocolwellia sp. AS88]